MPQCNDAVAWLTTIPVSPIPWNLLHPSSPASWCHDSSPCFSQVPKGFMASSPATTIQDQLAPPLVLTNSVTAIMEKWRLSSNEVIVSRSTMVPSWCNSYFYTTSLLPLRRGSKNKVRYRSWQKVLELPREWSATFSVSLPLPIQSQRLISLWGFHHSHLHHSFTIKTEGLILLLPLSVLVLMIG